MCHVRWRAVAVRIKNSPKRPVGFFQLLSFFLSATYSSFEFATIQEFFNAGGKNRREKRERSRTKSISNLKINANARAKLEVKGVENGSTGILHGSFANAFTFSRNTFELATQTAFCGLWSIALKLALIPFGCHAAFSTRRR